MKTLFHFSDNPGIAVFHPRPSPYAPLPVVWAISKERMAHYLLPRDCPRVCFRPGPQSSREDIQRHLGDDAAVVAIEVSWLERVQVAEIHRYTLPPETFELSDEAAGHWVSTSSVRPNGMSTISDLPGAIRASGAALRILPDLWSLHDAVAASSLIFSMIRMRNAAPRTGQY